LHTHTQLLQDDSPLLEWASARRPLAFLRNGEGLVGFGEAHTLAAHSIPELAAIFSDATADATVIDDVELPGTGLVAFGSFAFSPRGPSMLVIPPVIVGRRGGVTFVTTTISTPLDHRSTPLDHRSTPLDHRSTPLDHRSDIGAATSASFSPGSMSPKRYENAVGEVVRRIAAGEASKVVLARDLVGSFSNGSDLRAVLARLADAYPDTFTFAVDGLMGSSPETLVTVRAGTVSARVLAGTAARGADATADARAQRAIAASAKDLAEHDFAVQSVLSTLGRHTSRLDSGAGPYPLPLPNLWHLASDISGALTDGSTALDLVAALHPTAAVAGSPTSAALAMIAELEPFDRGRYAGPVGWVDANGDGEWAIALRCARFDNDTVTAYAGAGIVAESDPQRELAETELKFRPIVEALR